MIILQKIKDLKKLLNLPEKETRMKEETRKRINNYLNTKMFIDYAEYYELDESRVFFNIIPLFVNAAANKVFMHQQ